MVEDVEEENRLEKQRVSNPTAVLSSMAAIRTILLIIRGGEGDKRASLIAFSNDSSSATPVGVYYVADTNADGCQLELTSWDTAPLSHTAVILMCFSIDSPDSSEKSPESGRP
ncbi:hypothetical protein HPB50_014553 [Hyalomma asiaticum]|uniref:Uncharacterized protein n=1 Tax=Hyalomma asiaticum TaxID=266040 RepID=A0ACB7TKR9_HYAAI|nr:hypothetical protein HPB50_014553 [Hyalomma asiaticum]